MAGFLFLFCSHIMLLLTQVSFLFFFSIHLLSASCISADECYIIKVGLGTLLHLLLLFFRLFFLSSLFVLGRLFFVVFIFIHVVCLYVFVVTLGLYIFFIFTDFILVVFFRLLFGFFLNCRLHFVVLLVFFDLVFS